MHGTTADEARRNGGEVVPFDAYAGSEDRQGWFTREPLGIIVAITPYNDPLNLVAHKLGPAVAGDRVDALRRERRRERRAEEGARILLHDQEFIRSGCQAIAVLAQA
jgi:delta 1-pyrroline-5-carboxylate dehydrogenase